MTCPHTPPRTLSSWAVVDKTVKRGFAITNLPGREGTRPPRPSPNPLGFDTEVWQAVCHWASFPASQGPGESPPKRLVPRFTHKMGKGPPGKIYSTASGHTGARASSRSLRRPVAAPSCPHLIRSKARFRLRNLEPPCQLWTTRLCHVSAYPGRKERELEEETRGSRLEPKIWGTLSTRQRSRKMWREQRKGRKVNVTRLIGWHRPKEHEDSC